MEEEVIPRTDRNANQKISDGGVTTMLATVFTGPAGARVIFNIIEELDLVRGRDGSAAVRRLIGRKDAW